LLENESERITEFNIPRWYLMTVKSQAFHASVGARLQFLLPSQESVVSWHQIPEVDLVVESSRSEKLNLESIKSQRMNE